MKLQKLGRYELIRILGRGAMGLVYEGRDPNLDRRVAIKTIKVENLSTDEAAEYEVRFRTEARSAARLQHPNIVSVYDSDRDGNIAYIVMEYIQGEDLKQNLDQGQRYTLEQTGRIMRDLLAALEYAHSQNVVHRDIKPANLLMEASGRAKLTDFGVARIQDSSDATRTRGTLVGTLKYMSPEQLHGLPIDARTDLLSAGVVLYQLLTCINPFDGASDYEIIKKIVEQPASPPSTYNPLLPPALDQVVARALAKERDLRYQTAREFNDALQVAIATASDLTITPPPPQPADPGKWQRTVVTGAPQEENNGEDLTSVYGSQLPQEVELDYWKEISASEEAEDFRDFLLKFPNGVYSDLARRRFKKFSESVNGQVSRSDTNTDTRINAVPFPVPLPSRSQDAASAAQASATADQAQSAASAEPDPSADLAPAPSPQTQSAGPQRRWLLAAVAAGIVFVIAAAYMTMGGKPKSELAQDAASPGTASNQASKSDKPAAAAAGGGANSVAEKTRDSGADPARQGQARPLPVAKPQSPESASSTKTSNARTSTTPQPTGKARDAAITTSARPEEVKASSTTDKPRSAAETPPRTAPAAPSKTAAAQPPTPAPGTTAAPGSNDPEQICSGRDRQSCIKTQCELPRFARHKVCMDLKALERSLQSP